MERLFLKWFSGEALITREEFRKIEKELDFISKFQILFLVFSSYSVGYFFSKEMIEFSFFLDGNFYFLSNRVNFYINNDLNTLPYYASMIVVGVFVSVFAIPLQIYYFIKNISYSENNYKFSNKSKATLIVCVIFIFISIYFSFIDYPGVYNGNFSRFAWFFFYPAYPLVSSFFVLFANYTFSLLIVGVVKFLRMYQDGGYGRS